MSIPRVDTIKEKALLNRKRRKTKFMNELDEKANKLIGLAADEGRTGTSLYFEDLKNYDILYVKECINDFCTYLKHEGYTVNISWVCNIIYIDWS